MHPVSQTDWLSEPTDNCHTYKEPTQHLAGSRQIRRLDSCWLWGISLAHIANCNNHFSPYLKQISKNQLPLCSFFCSTVFKQARWAGQVSASSDPCCDHWADSPRSIRSFYWHKADTNLKESDLCLGFAITFISCSHWETNLGIKVWGARKLCFSSSSTEICSRQETGQLTVE